MRHLNESIIGRKGIEYSNKYSKIPGNLYDEQDLDYGDIIRMNNNAYYIYLPKKMVVGWWEDPTRLPESSGLLVRYSYSNIKSQACFFGGSRADREECMFIRYVKEYKNIRKPKDIKSIFDKYHIIYF